MVQSAENSRKLKEIEDKILEVLSNSQVGFHHIIGYYQLLPVGLDGRVPETEQSTAPSRPVLTCPTLIRRLITTQGNILEDETAIQIITEAKTLGNEIAEKQKVGQVDQAWALTCIW